VTVKRMDNVGIVVKDIDVAIEFFTELGLELEGRAPVNALGYLRVMFTVDDIGPEGVLIGLAQQLGQQAARENPMGRKR